MTDKPKPAPTTSSKRILLLYPAMMLVMLVLTIAVLLLLQNISQRKHEAREVAFRMAELNETSIDPKLWAQNFPRQYDSYRRTVDMVGTKYGGSEADPTDPRHHDKLTKVEDSPKTWSRIEADPRLKTMWAGYAFATDFREERGHAYMLHDQRDTERVKQFNQPGSCLHCHASNALAYRQAGLEAGAAGTLDEPLTSPHGYEQLDKGFVKISAMPYAQATKLVDHPVSCIDCHDPKTMQLRVTKPGFLRGIRVLAESQEPVGHLPSIERWRQSDRKTPYDPNALASRQEMRSMACGQCHVEYYCGPKATLFFPWNNGLKIEQIEAYYDQYKFSDGSRFMDWKHKITGAAALKAQHPEFEMWSQGIHAQAGVSCADCHMPYKREGAVKVSDHQVRSPMNNLNNACQTCHRVPEEELKQRVITIQDRTKKLMDRAMDGLVLLIAELKQAKDDGLSEQTLTAALEFQRKSQWRIDFINAENSMGFHAPQEAARILGEACDYAQQGRLEVMKARQTAGTKVSAIN